MNFEFRLIVIEVHLVYAGYDSFFDIFEIILLTSELLLISVFQYIDFGYQKSL